jgi:hypothetical protein
MGVPSVSTLAEPPTARFGAIGQSLGAFLWYATSSYAFQAKFNEIMRGSGNTALVAGGFEIAPFAIGGSFASRANQEAAATYRPDQYGVSTVHYDDVDDTGYSVSGVCFDARERMDARLSGNQVVHLLNDQGQADAVAAAGLTALTPAEGADNWLNAWSDLTTGYRQYLENASSGRIMQVLLGRSLSLTNTWAYQRIRQKQLAYIGASGGAVIKALEAWDLEYADSVHPSIAGQTVYGERLAEMVALRCYGVTSYVNASGATITIYNGPSIASASLSSDGLTATVTLTQESGDTIYMPPRDGPPPCGFAFYSAAADMDRVFTTGDPPPIQRPTQPWGWNSTSRALTFPLTTPITGGLKLAFPADNVPDFNPDLVISGRTSGKPLQTWPS